MQRFAIFVFIIVVLVAPLAYGGTRAFDYRANLGVASQSADSVCLTIANRHLAAGQAVTLVILAPDQAIAQAKIVRTMSTDCTGVDSSESTVAYYELHIVKGALSQGAPAIAVVNPARAVRISAGSVVADLDGNHQLEYFRECTSSEGVHLTVWTGMPPKGKRRWHEYYYLGYDVEPNCTDAEAADGHP